MISFGPRLLGEPANKKGKLSLVLADLPCPHGFGPIPNADATKPPASEVAKSPPASEAKASTSAQKIGDTPAAQIEAKKPLTLQEKQVMALEKRQSQFKAAALSAKKAGQIDAAKEYLRKAKGFDSLIEAAKSGLPVDFKSLPVAPQAVKGNSKLFVSFLF